MPRVTVYLPAYQHERHVGAAIGSVLAQDFTDFELIVCDDASTDGTWGAIQRYQSDPRVRIFRNGQNLGASATARRCLEHARGEFIAPMASDDRWLPGKLGRQVGALDARPEVVAAFSVPGFIDETDARLDPPPPAYADFFEAVNRPRAEWRRHFFEGHCGLFLISALIRFSAYREVGGFDARMEQFPDFDLFVRLAGVGEFWVSPDREVDFRIHSDGENLSAPALGKLPRLNREWVHLMRHFREPGVDWLELAERSWALGTQVHRWFAIDTALAIDPATLPIEEQERLAQFTRQALAAAPQVWPAPLEGLAEAARVVEATRAEVRKLRAALEKEKSKTAVLREKLERRP